MNNIKNIIKYSKTLKLLYVEDNIEAIESTLIVLNEFFGNITVANNGADGLKQFIEHNTEESFDIIITDINMPKLNGLEMIDKIREINKDIPILVLSAYNESGYFIESIKLGVEGYLLKPIDIKQFLGVMNKITLKLELALKLRKNEILLNQYKEITDKSAIISIIDTKGVITYANDIFCKISQYSKEELIGTDYHSVLHYKQTDEIYKYIWKTIEEKKEIWQGVLKFVSRYGNPYYFKTTIKPILDEDNNIVEYIASRYDVTEIMNPKKQFYDAIIHAQNSLVIYMKLEEFKILEEFYDNKTVEEIQDKIHHYLESHLPKALNFEKIYQLGNGEYAMTNEKDICITSDSSIDSFVKDVKLYQEVIKNGTIDIGDIDYDMSIIVSLAYDDTQILDSSKLGIRELLNTKQNFIISNDLAQDARDKAKENMKIIAMVKKAINDSKIVSYYQPIINNKTQQIEKYESLVRLIDENGKVLSPFFFLDVSKKGTYYSQITNIVLENSFTALKTSQKDISINISAIDIEQTSTRDNVFKLLKDYEQYSSRIVFELLEDESVKDFKTIKKFIHDVKQLGVKIAIDDFGAGYSNFERLLDYQPDILKIDGCLTRDIQTNDYSYSVVKTIVAFAKEQNIQTVAEFVENEEIFNILNELGVDYSQGYYFGKPEALAV